MKIIEKIGFFRLTLIPLGLVILFSAYRNGIWGMGLIGALILIFGSLNKCLLFGKCDVADEPSNKSKNTLTDKKA